jgi:methylmalonyl-CoA mutase
MVDRLRARGVPHVRVYGGGGGTILPEEIAALEGYGVAKIFSPEDGRALGLEGMIEAIVRECRFETVPSLGDELERLDAGDPRAVARVITYFEAHGGSDEASKARAALNERIAARGAPKVVGFTGTGGAGKSSVVDEITRRFRRDFPDARLALLLVDPSRRRSGGALLGDRIRMNAIHGPNVYVRSMGTRAANLAVAESVRDALAVLAAAGFDLIVVETAGIGQSGSEVVDLADISAYVMTPEYGAPSQLEKIDMLELADLVILNKFDRQGGSDALRDVRKQWKRNHRRWDTPDDALPVFPTVASQWDDPGVDRAYAGLCERLVEAGASRFAPRAGAEIREVESAPLVPGSRVRYLAEIAECLRGYRARAEADAEVAANAEALSRAIELVGGGAPGLTLEAPAGERPDPERALRERHREVVSSLDPSLRDELRRWPERAAEYRAEAQSYVVRGKTIHVRNHVETLAHTRLPKVALPRATAWSELARFLRKENLPGCFPFTAGVFPFRREGEDPARMFAGEGGPERTNRRFHFLAKGQPAARLSTAFDSVTLYGRDPEARPDVYGKVGNSGVSVPTIDDAKKLYSGFDLCDPRTSVSMTINGPAPMVLAFFMNAAIDQQVERHLRAEGKLDEVRARFGALPSYGGELPSGHDGLGLGLLGIPGDAAVPRETYERIKADALRTVRGTVQADILKEDQAQNTCIFSTGFALRTMGDIQRYFVDQQVRNFYSVSVSGYHIAEAGANPITQLAFTLANGFTYVEHYLARGMAIDDFAPNFSFFFSNGLDAEYNVIGRVARRIWAVAMRERYGASERSQKLKYHVQTSGRSLHAQEMAFNDIRTTLQALTALQDNCNSLHTNAYDEAVTTPTEESVRRAVAIQLIINRELGIQQNENALQGAYIVEELTDLVEEAVLEELDRLSARGGVLGAMETLYQRGKIQEESLYYETRKHSGELPIVGVNTFENPEPEVASARPAEVMRSTSAEKDAQLRNLHAFQARHREEAERALERLKARARAHGNVFEELMETVKHASLGQITEALFDVGGSYRRSM